MYVSFNLNFTEGQRIKSIHMDAIKEDFHFIWTSCVGMFAGFF